MAKLTPTRVAEMLNDLEDYETEWDDFETKFIRSIQSNMEEYGDNFELIGKQEETLVKIYDRFCKKPT